jgi:hypothetical protein
MNNIITKSFILQNNEAWLGLIVEKKKRYLLKVVQISCFIKSLHPSCCMQSVGFGR